MPNWVRNNVRCSKLKEMRERYADPEFKTELSFNKVVPLPEEAMETPFGAVPFWGTKWNAKDPTFVEGDDPHLTFDTAWSMPDEIFHAMSKQLGCRIDVEYADEDWGSNAGLATYYPDGSSEEHDRINDPDYSAQIWGEKDYVTALRNSGCTEEEIEEDLEYWAKERGE